MAEQRWETYEQVAAYLLNKVREDLGLARVEGKQEVPGASGTTWVIDAKGVRSTDGSIVVIECRRHTTRAIEQEATGGLAFRIQDTGASGAILVSPLGLQEGAVKVAAASGILEVRLNADATAQVFAMRFLNQLRLGVAGSEVRAESGNPTVIFGKSD